MGAPAARPRAGRDERSGCARDDGQREAAQDERLQRPIVPSDVEADGPAKTAAGHVAASPEVATMPRAIGQRRPTTSTRPATTSVTGWIT